MPLGLVLAFNVLFMLVLVLLFRYRDKRNSQLRLLRSFVSKASKDLTQLFDSRERALKDKTILLDITLKKIDKSSEHIDSRLHEMKNYLDTARTFQESLDIAIQDASLVRNEYQFLKSQFDALNLLADRFQESELGILRIEGSQQELQAHLDQAISEQKLALRETFEQAEQALFTHKDALNQASAQRIQALEQDLLHAIQNHLADIQTLEQNNASAHQELDSIKQSLDNLEEHIQEISSNHTHQLDTSLDAIRSQLEQNFATQKDAFLVWLQEQKAQIQTQIATILEKFYDPSDLLTSYLAEKEQWITNELNQKLQTMQAHQDTAEQGILSTIQDLETQSARAAEAYTQALELFDHAKSNLHSQQDQLDSQMEQLFQKLHDLDQASTSSQHTLQTMDNHLQHLSNEQLPSFWQRLDEADQQLLALQDKQQKHFASNQADQTRAVEQNQALLQSQREDLERHMAESKAQLETTLNQAIETGNATLQEALDNQSAKVQNELLRFQESLAPESQRLLRDFQQQAQELEDSHAKKINQFEQSVDGKVQQTHHQLEHIYSEMTRLSHEVTNIEANALSQLQMSADTWLEDKHADLGQLQVQWNQEELRIRERVSEDMKQLNKKARDTENRLSTLNKRLDTLDKIPHLNDKVQKFYTDLDAHKREIAEQIQGLVGLEKQSQEVRRLQFDLETRERKAEQFMHSMEEALSKFGQLGDLTDQLNRQYNPIMETQTLLQQTLNLGAQVEEQLQRLSQRQQALDLVERLAQESQNQDQMLQSQRDLIQDIQSEASKLSAAIQKSEESIDQIFREQGLLSSAVHKLADIENLLIHIDEEKKKVDGMRHWVARMQNQLESMQTNQYTLAKGNKTGRKSIDEEKTSASVLRLHQQGWSLEEIADSLGISRAYIELILETRGN